MRYYKWILPLVEPGVIDGRLMYLIDEATWVDRARHDPQAIRLLYDHYFPRLYAYVSYRVVRIHDTEDLVSEIFLKVIERIESFEWRHKDSFAAWLFRIAHNEIADYYRRQDRQGRPLQIEEISNRGGNQLLPDDLILRNEKFAYVRRLVDTLPTRQQEVITLRFFGELRNQEIAQVLGLRERTVASYLCRGLEKLHDMYDEDFSQADVARKAGSERPNRSGMQTA